MQFFNEFDLDDFLAYLLPGSLLVIQYLLAGGPVANTQTMSLPDSATTLLSVSAFLAISLGLGHVCSLWSRSIVRPILRHVLGNPEESVFGGVAIIGTNDAGTYSSEFRQLIAAKFNQVFNTQIGAVNLAAQDMIKCHVLKSHAAAMTLRDRIVRARSLCGNMTLPCAIGAVQLLTAHQMIVAAMIGLVGVALACKQHILDRREYRTINSLFVVN